MNKIELLAPAGDLERLKVAIDFGADAVYVGGPTLNLRANAINFNFEDLRKGVEYVHGKGKKIYVTLNITPHKEEIIEVYNYVEKLKKPNIDAIIATDLRVIEIIKELGVTVHISTQTSIMNDESAKFYQKLGAERIVLARETDIDSLKKIIKTGVETEVFIHGAICAGVSGRCVLSNYMSNRDSNRGGCSQSCRFTFKVSETNVEDYTFCTKDLMMLTKLRKIMNLGVTSLKIEGRMRSIYYIATVVAIYRKTIDKLFEQADYIIPQKDIDDLNKCANREHSNQFFDEEYKSEYQYYNGRKEVSNQDFLGLILDVKDGLHYVEQRNYFKRGDKIEIFGKSYNVRQYIIKKVYDEEMEEIEIVRHPKQRVYIEIDGLEEPSSFIRKQSQII